MGKTRRGIQPGDPLTPYEAAVYAALKEGPKTLEELVDALYGGDPEGGPVAADKNVYIFLHNIRIKRGVPIPKRTVYTL